MGEEDLFALRIMLILLSLNDVLTCRTFWDAVQEARPVSPDKLAETAGAAATEPTLVVQCGTFLLAAAEAKSLQFFRTVRGRYALVLRRDSTFERFLDEIEINVFDAPKKQGGLGALFNAFLGGGQRTA